MWLHAWGWSPVPFLRAAIFLRGQLLPICDILACLPETQGQTWACCLASISPAPPPSLGALGGHREDTPEGNFRALRSVLPRRWPLAGLPSRSSVSGCPYVEACQSVLLPVTETVLYLFLS